MRKILQENATDCCYNGNLIFKFRSCGRALTYVSKLVKSANKFPVSFAAKEEPLVTVQTFLADFKFQETRGLF